MANNDKRYLYMTEIVLLSELDCTFIVCQTEVAALNSDKNYASLHASQCCKCNNGVRSVYMF